MSLWSDMEKIMEFVKLVKSITLDDDQSKLGNLWFNIIIFDREQAPQSYKYESCSFWDFPKKLVVKFCGN